MADTIISNTPGSQEDSGMAGWFLAFVVIIAIVIAGFTMYQNGFFGSNPDSTTNINVTIPDPIIQPVPPVTAD